MSLMIVKIWQVGNTINDDALPDLWDDPLLLRLNTDSKIADVKQHLNAELEEQCTTLNLFTSVTIYNIKPLGDDMILGAIGVPIREQVRNQNHNKPVRVLKLYVTGSETIFNKYNPAKNPANFTTHVLKNKINF
tara:strand:- start:329 stop:730 length:402 start_codon:yes stop_codon:yes gene_type:complete